MSDELFFDYLAMRLNGPKADGKTLLLNVNFTDVSKKYMLEMENGILNHTPDAQSETADATITMTRETMNQIILGQTTGEKEVKAGNVKIGGSADALKELVSLLDIFEFWFNIVTP